MIRAIAGWGAPNFDASRRWVFQCAKMWTSTEWSLGLVDYLWRSPSLLSMDYCPTTDHPSTNCWAFESPIVMGHNFQRGRMTMTMATSPQNIWMSFLMKQMGREKRRLQARTITCWATVWTCRTYKSTNVNIESCKDLNNYTALYTDT